jgi:hypothetical protein
MLAATWVMASLALLAVLIQMMGDKIKSVERVTRLEAKFDGRMTPLEAQFESRMTRLEVILTELKSELDAIHRRMDSPS